MLIYLINLFLIINYFESIIFKINNSFFTYFFLYNFFLLIKILISFFLLIIIGFKENIN